MQTGAIIRRNAGCFIPNEYLELALGKNPKGWGAAVVIDGELNVNHSDEPLTMELFNDTLKTFKDSDITFYVCDSSAAINQADISPYTLLKNGDTVLLAAFIEGNFPGAEKAGSSHPPEFFLANEYLTQKLSTVAELVDNDIEKILAFCDKPNFKSDLLLRAVSRGTITLVASNGKVLNYSIGDTSMEYKWGWVSNHYNYAKAKEEPKKEEAPKKVSMFPNRSTVREKAPSTAIAPAVSPPKTDTTAIKNFTKRKEAPPRGFSRSQKKDWYKSKVGHLPNGWKEDCPVEVYVDGSGKVIPLSEIKKLGLAAAGLPKLQNPAGVKDTESEHIPEPKKIESKENKEKSVTMEQLPVLTPTAREHIKKMMSSDTVVKLIQENADIIHDPKKVQALEEKFADFAHQLGMKSMDDFLCWDYAMFHSLCKENADGAAVMLFTFRNIIAGNKAKAAKIEEVVETKPSMFPKKKVA